MKSQLILNFILWIMLGFIRSGVVALLSPLLRRIGYGLSVKEAVVMVWGGLRGAVSLSLALLVDGNHLIGDRARELIFIQTAGIVTLTLVINGTTSGMLYKMLKVYPPNPFRPALATKGLRNIQTSVDHAVSGLKSHWFHKNSDIAILQRLVPNFSDAYMVDGDLVEVLIQPMEQAWALSTENILKPVPFLTSDARDQILHGVKIQEFCSTVSTLEPSDTSSQDPEQHAHQTDSHSPQGHGHNQGSSSADRLKNIRRWLQNSDVTVDHKVAMYDILLTSMRSHFAHMREAKGISVQAYNKLNAAIGSGLDLNDAVLTADLESLPRDVSRNSGIAADTKIPERNTTPLDACVDYVVQFSSGVKIDAWFDGPNANRFFEHRLVSAEMFMALIEQLRILTESELADGFESFLINVKDCLRRASLALAEMQLASPNTLITCHTVLSFNQIAADFYHQLHEYRDQGFLTEDVVDAAQSAMATRHQEIAQYFTHNILVSILRVPIDRAMNRQSTHPVFNTFAADQLSVNLKATVESNQPPASASPAHHSLHSESTSQPAETVDNPLDQRTAIKPVTIAHDRVGGSETVDMPTSSAYTVSLDAAGFQADEAEV